MSQLSLLNMCESKKQWYIHDLLNVPNNPTKFQLNQIRTSNFELKTDTAVTLKCQGHQKCDEQVKLNV